MLYGERKDGLNLLADTLMSRAVITQSVRDSGHERLQAASSRASITVSKRSAILAAWRLLVPSGS
jgi:hypothetical protein